MFQIIWAKEAENDYIETIYFWIEHNKSEQYSKKLIAEVEKAEKKLSEFPFSGSNTDFNNVYKISILKKFSIYYRVKSGIIEIVAFWDNRRNPEDLEV
jgi:plasmid stabilization system protein ParE